MTPNSFKTEKTKKAGKMLGRKQKQTKSALTFRLIVNIMEELERIRKIKCPSFYCQYRGSRKGGFEPRNPRIDFWCRDKQINQITTTHIIWWTQCQCNTISSSSVVMTKSNQIKKSNELWAIYDIEQQQQIIDDVLSSTNHHFYKTHDNHNIVYFIH